MGLADRPAGLADRPVGLADHRMEADLADRPVGLEDRRMEADRPMDLADQERCRCRRWRDRGWEPRLQRWMTS